MKVITLPLYANHSQSFWRYFIAMILSAISVSLNLSFSSIENAKIKSSNWKICLLHQSFHPSGWKFSIIISFAFNKYLRCWVRSKCPRKKKILRIKGVYPEVDPCREEKQKGRKKRVDILVQTMANSFAVNDLINFATPSDRIPAVANDGSDFPRKSNENFKPFPFARKIRCKKAVGWGAEDKFSSLARPSCVPAKLRLSRNVY